MKQRDARLAVLQAERQSIGRVSRPAFNAQRVRDELLELAYSWRRVLADDPNHARPIVSSLLKGRVNFTPVAPKRWRLRGNGSLIGLFEREVFTCSDGVPNG